MKNLKNTKWFELEDKPKEMAESNYQDINISFYLPCNLKENKEIWEKITAKYYHAYPPKKVGMNSFPRHIVVKNDLDEIRKASRFLKRVLKNKKLN